MARASPGARVRAAGPSRRAVVTTLRPVPDARLTVLVACGESLARAGYRAVLNQAPGITVAGEAGTGLEAIELARQLRPDVVVADIGISELDCAETTRCLRSDTGVPVIFLTALDDDERVFGAFRAGACGVLSKDAAP